MTKAIVGTTPNVWSNHRVQVFWENNFLCFGGPHTSKTFWSELWCWSYRFWTSQFLAKLSLDISKAMARIKKVLEVWPPSKSGFWGLIKVFWTLRFDQTMGMVPTMALVNWVPSHQTSWHNSWDTNAVQKVDNGKMSKESLK